MCREDTVHVDIGNVVGQISASEITEVTTVTSMQELIGPREPGLNFLSGRGNVGAGSTIRRPRSR